MGIVITTYRPLFSYHVSKDMPADVENTWKAWNDPDQYAEWFNAVPGSIELDVREGGAWKLTIGSGETSEPGDVRSMTKWCPARGS